MAESEKNTPQFGGFCAFAVSKGFTAKADPTAWYVVNNRLYLFADKNVRTDWVNRVEQGVIAKSERNWATHQASNN
jgi:hypothetical protein